MSSNPPASDIESSVTDKAAQLAKRRELLNRFGQALSSIEEHTWDAWNPEWLGIDPTLSSQNHLFFREQDRDWLT